MNKKGLEMETVLVWMLGIALLIFFILYFSGLGKSMIEIIKGFFESFFG